jgi:hypothetical protein
MVHHNFVPGNAYRIGVVNLMDFGIAKIKGLSMMRTGFGLRTPATWRPVG